MNQPLPTGVYDGRTLSPWLVWTRLIWRGKVFTGASVVNRIGPWRLIRGKATTARFLVIIRYPGGLTDLLIQRVDGGYDGRLLLGPITIRFELTPARARKQRGK